MKRRKIRRFILAVRQSKISNFFLCVTGAFIHTHYFMHKNASFCNYIFYRKGKLYCCKSFRRFIPSLHFDVCFEFYRDIQSDEDFFLTMAFLKVVYQGLIWNFQGKNTAPQVLIKSDFTISTWEKCRFIPFRRFITTCTSHVVVFYKNHKKVFL